MYAIKRYCRFICRRTLKIDLSASLYGVKVKTRAEAIAVLTAVDQEYEVVAGESWGRPCRLFKNV